MKPKYANRVRDFYLDGYEFMYSHRFLVGTFLVSLISIIIASYVFLPNSTLYSFSGNNCISKITVLPNLHSSSQTTVDVSHQDGITILNNHIISGKTCYQLNELAPEGDTITVSKEYFGLSWLNHKTNITIANYPKLGTDFSNLAPVPINGGLSFKLSAKDEHFDYYIKIDKNESKCQEVGEDVNCEIATFKLKHKTDYRAEIQREFLGQRSQVATVDFNTVEPVTIVQASVDNGAKLTKRLSEIELKADKDIKSIEDVILASEGEKYNTEIVYKNKNIKVSFKEDLPRGRDYQLSIAQIIGVNNESLAEKYTNSFYLAPGPSLTGMSLNDRATPLNANIKLYFGQTLGDDDYSKYIDLRQNDKPMNYTVSRYGSVVTVNPSGNFIKCASIKVTFKGVVSNNYGITKPVDWTGNSRTTCASSFTLGRSVQGRSIIGYNFGSGSKEVLYIAALHGDESNSKRLLDQWLWELEGNPGKIPSGVKVTVIPLLNPDGYAKGSRFNANTVDLNRNFPANNWKADVVLQGGKLLENGGGTEALSEPESSAIANYISARRPYLVLTFHSQGGIVESNESGIANSKTGRYTNLSGYGYKLASQNTGFFKYDINGSLEEWAHDKLGQPVLLIELSSSYYHEFSRNKAAMWAMLE